MSGLDIVVTHRIDLSDATLAVLTRLLDAWATRPSLPPVHLAAAPHRIEVPPMLVVQAKAAPPMAPTTPATAPPIPATPMRPAPPLVAPPLVAPPLVAPPPVAPPPVAPPAARPRAAPGPAARLPIAAPPIPDPGPRFSNARNLVILRDWPLGLSAHDIKPKLDALPGPPVPVDRISIQAAGLHVRRPAGHIPHPPRRAFSLDTAMADAARDAAAQTAPAAMDWDAAIQWAQANNVAVDIRASTRVVERTINAARATHQLTPWVLVPTRTVMAPLPPPHLGAKYDGAHA